MAVKIENVLPVGWLGRFTEHPRIGIGIDPAACRTG